MNEKKRSSLPPNLYIFPITFAFFAAGVACLSAAVLYSFWNLPPFVKQQNFHTPEGIFLAHLLLLGWATMISMGASYQITQVILRRAVFSRKLAGLHLVSYILGVVILLFGFWSWIPFAMALGGTLVVLGVMAFAINQIITYTRAKQWSPVIVGAIMSLFDLIITVLLGTMLGTGWDQRNHGLWFSTHLWLGIGGWLSGLIISYSLKLLPMFYVSKKKASRQDYAIVILFQIGVWLSAVGQWFSERQMMNAGLIIITFSLGLLTWFAYDVRRQSSGKQPVGAVRVPDALIAMTFILFLTWSAVHLFSSPNVTLPPSVMVTSLILYLVFGWFTSSILAYLSKIIPFLWWAHRFRTKEEKKGAVLLSEMVPQNRLTIELWIYGLGAGILLASWMCSSSAGATAAIIIMVISVAVYLVELGKVFRY